MGGRALRISRSMRFRVLVGTATDVLGSGIVFPLDMRQPHVHDALSNLPLQARSEQMKATFKNRLLKLADIIENNKPIEWKGRPVKFDMSEWGHERSCGTAACIAGHAAILSGQPFDPKAEYALGYERGNTARKVAAEWLGIKDYEESIRLFIPTNHGYTGRLENITRRRAAAVLRSFAETGKITWNMRLPKQAAK